MAKNDNVEFGKFRKNIMGTLSFEMKLPNMRKAQDFIVYPVNEKTDYIMIQSDTRFGKIEMTTGRGLMSQSHANGAYAVHLHIDKLVKFELTESQLEKLKEEIAKTAGRNVGSAGVVSDNEYADKFAKGGYMASGGELVDKTIDHSGRYLDIVGNHRMLHIHLNDEGREMVMEERENGRGDEEIMYELFEDVAGNSDLMYHTDLGESGFGMTSSSGVTAGYVYGDDGELEPADDTAVVYVDNDSYRRSPIEEMLHTHLVLKNSDFMAKGGKTRSKKDNFIIPMTDGFMPKEYDKPRGKTIYVVEDEDDDGEVVVHSYDNYDEAISAHSMSKLKGYQISWYTELETKKPPFVYESGIVLTDGSLAVRRRRGREVNPDGNEIYAKGGMTFGGKMHGAGMFAEGGVLGKEENYERRLKFINEDIKRVLENLPEEYLNIPIKDYERIAILLHNIEIASDIKDDESDNWTFAKGGHMAKGGRTGKTLKVKDWYMKNYPTDDLGSEINDTISFKDLWAYMSQGNDVYDVLGVGDSLVRERVFEKLSEVYGVEYDAVYKMWLNS